MNDNIKELKTWAEAERWLSKHGYGLTQIALEKKLWDEANKPAPVPVTPTAPVAKPINVSSVSPNSKPANKVSTKK